MLLESKNAVICGGGGSVGGAVARAFARKGARVFLAGRTLATLDEVAEEITTAGGAAETAQVDALDETAVEEHADAVAEKAGGIDLSFNAIFNDGVQVQPLAEMPFEDFAWPITKAMRNQFLTARAVARHMVEWGSRVILTITGVYREALPTIGGTVVAWAAIEAQCRQWACELGPQGVRVVWLRTTGLPEAIPDTGDAAADRPEDADRLFQIRNEPEVVRRWGSDDIEEEISEEFIEADDAFVIEAGGEVVGAIQYHEENEPMYRHAGIDVFLTTSRHGQGLGTKAIRLLARYLFEERGHHRLTIDPAADNAAAIRAYEKVGFRRVGIMRNYERGPDGAWHDGLLMDMLQEEFRR